MTHTESNARANRLIASTSPYLLQHAHNPVDWFPWGEEASAKAKREGKPIFLSIGYSACHWCHVMERESFENARIANYLNEHFVAIKVDREERPDLDEIYMACVQLLTGSGGWPMSVFLTPDGRPFFGGTYYPPEDRWGRPGFMSLLVSLREAYEKEHEKVAGNAAAITRAIEGIADGYEEDDTAAAEEFKIDKHGGKVLEEAVRGLAARFDPHWAGFGGAPKFPPSMGLALLLRQRRRTGEGRLLEMTEATLDRMARGGIYDQLAGGFHRYSTDERWLAPHFEKMLYDNALLAPVYFDAWRVTGDAFYRNIGRETLDWVLNEMVDAEGGFHSALDADSEGMEGKYYIWKPEEIAAVLGHEDAALFCDCFDVRKGGNWHEGGGASILNVPKPLAAFGAALGEDVASLRARLDAMRAKLLAERGKRIAPMKDDKVLAGWNGLMISALSLGTQATGDARYAEAASNAARFILSRMRGADGGLLRAWRAGKGHIAAFLEDYGPVVSGLIDLYETQFDAALLSDAEALAEGMIRRFSDAAGAVVHSTDGLDGSVIVRMKDTMDGATPSGAASAVHALRRLGILLGREDFSAAARRTIEALGSDLRARGQGHQHLLCALSDEIDPPVELAIIGKRGDPATEELFAAAWEAYLPGRMIALASQENRDAAGAEAKIAILQGKSAAEGRATAWICRGASCLPAARSAAELNERLAQKA